MATQATQIPHNYNMIEDYALAVWPPVAQNVQHAFLTLQNPAGGTPVNELLTVSDQNQLLHFFRDPSAHSGWGQEALDSSYQNGWTETGNVIAPIPASDATEGISPWFLMGIAATCDLGTLATTVAGDATSS